MQRSTIALVLLFGCAPPRAPSEIEALDAACMRGEDTCDEAAARYAKSDSPEAASRRSEMLYQACRREPARCDDLARNIASGALPPPPRRRVAALYEHVCGTRYPRHEAACMAAALFGRRCDEGHAPSCANLAGLAAEGRLGEGATKRLRALYGRACDGGHAPSCLAVAGLVDPVARARRLAQGCDGGSREACLALGDSHAIGRGVAIDQGLARRFRGRACELDLGEGCHALATMMARGVGGGVDRRRAVELEAKACERGVAAACEAHGRALEWGAAGKPPDPAAAYDRYRRAVQGYGEACEGGDPAGCVRRAVLVEEGSGTSADRDEARSLLARACAGGDAEGCLRLAVRGDRLDTALLEEHRTILARACRQGAGEACLAVARLGDEGALERGCSFGSGPSCAAAATSLPLGSAEGRARAERACALADAGGCHLLGTITELGGDLEAALAWHREACLWGHGPACTRTGVLLLRGDVRLEPLAAASSLDRGCELGDSEACLELGLIELAGDRVALDVPHGKGALERSCRAGFAAGCGALGAELLRGRHLEIDLDRGAALLRGACDQGDDASCLELAEALGGQLPRNADESRRVLEAVASRGGRRCEAALSTCHGGGPPQATAWMLERGLLRRRLVDPPRCGAELERACNGAREALRRLCADDGAHCWQTAVLERRMAAGGLAASLAAAAEHEAAAVRWARPACARSEARACAVMFHAHDEGRGAKADAQEADRFRVRACQLDPGFCP